MKRDPFYVKDSFTEQLEREEQMRNEKRKAFMDEQRRYYQEYLKRKDQSKSNKIKNIEINNPIKITDEQKFYKPHHNIDAQNDNLCTNVAKDNMYARTGYEVKPFTPRNENKINEQYNIINMKQNEQKQEQQPMEDNSNVHYNKGIEDIYNNEFKIKKENEEVNANKNYIQVDKREYSRYLDYLKYKEDLEKQQMLEEYIARKKEQEEIERQNELNKNNYVPPPNLPMNYHMKSKDNSNFNNYMNIPKDDYIKQYAQQMKQKEPEEKTESIPLDPMMEAKQEYLSNKNKNNSSYTNLTHLMTLNPSLKTVPKKADYINPDKQNEIQMKLEKQRLYRESLDEQMKARPQSAMKKESIQERNALRKEIPPNPCKYNNLNKYRLRT